MSMICEWPRSDCRGQPERGRGSEGDDLAEETGVATTEAAITLHRLQSIPQARDQLAVELRRQLGVRHTPGEGDTT